MSVFLVFGKHFNQKLENLPNLVHLVLGQDFNQKLENLPVKLDLFEFAAEHQIETD